MLTVVTSGKSSPGVTASTWALALAWPRPVLVADCDPVGGDMAAGFLAGRVSQDRGLLSWATAARRGTPAMQAAALLASHSVELPEQPNVWLLPGFTNMTQGWSFTDDVWERLALALERSAAVLGRDAIVDTGRLVGERTPWPVIHAADQVLVAVRPSVRSVHAAQDAVGRLRSELGDLAKVRALVVGDGPYSPDEAASVLQLNQAGRLPADRNAACALTDGASTTMRALQKTALLKASAGLVGKLAVVSADLSAGYAGTETSR
jgi:hypothetical protein